MTVTRIDVFGGMRASVDGAALPSFTSRPAGLLALLTLARCRPVSTSELVAWLWGTDPAPSAANQLQRLVGHLRRTFEPGLAPRSAGQVVVNAGDGYRLADAVQSDLFDLERQVADRRSAASEPTAVLQVVARAPFVGLERVLAEHPLFVAVERQCVGIALHALGEYRADEEYRSVVDLVEVVAARFPFEESLQAALVRALGAVGRRSDAVALYGRVRTSLRDELGVDPGPDLRAAHAALLAADRPVGPAARAPSQLPRVVGGFVARPDAQRELDRIAEVGGAGAVVVTAIGGMGGIGKTTLAVAWAHQLAPRFPDGQLYVNLRGFDAHGDVMTVPEALSVLLTALGGTPADADAGVDARSALLRSRLAGRRYLVVLDNARDAEQVRPLLPGDPGCLAVVTSRNRLTSLVTREGAVPVHLDRMSDGEAEDLLARRLGTEALLADPASTASVLRACDGLPLALALVATRVAIEPRLTLTDIARELDGTNLTSWSADVGSEDLRAVFAWSLRGLGDSSVQAFQIVAAHPAARMSFPSLVSLLGRGSEHGARVLRELCDVNLLHQLDRDHFALHDLLRAYARAMPDPERRVDAAQRRLVNHLVRTARNADATRGLTHRRPPEALLAGVVPERFAAETGAQRWYLAEHEAVSAITGLALARGWTRAAANIVMDTRTMAQPFETGRERAQLLYEVLEAAGGLDADDAFADRALLGDLLRVIAANRSRSGDLEIAERYFARAEGLLLAAGDRLALGQLIRGVGRLHVARQDYQAAQDAYERALELVDSEDAPAVEVLLHIDIGNTHFFRGDWRAAVEANDRAIAIERKERSEGTLLVIAHLNRAENLFRMQRFGDALDAVAASREAGGDSDAYRVGLLSVQARIALGAGDLSLARRSVQEFRRFVDSKDAGGLGHSYYSGIRGLQAHIDEVALALGDVHRPTW